MNPLDPEPLRQCEYVGGCQEWRGLKLYPVAEPDGRRSYHWFCELHRPREDSAG